MVLVGRIIYQVQRFQVSKMPFYKGVESKEIVNLVVKSKSIATLFATFFFEQATPIWQVKRDDNATTFYIATNGLWVQQEEEIWETRQFLMKFEKVFILNEWSYYIRLGTVHGDNHSFLEQTFGWWSSFSSTWQYLLF